MSSRLYSAALVTIVALFGLSAVPEQSAAAVVSNVTGTVADSQTITVVGNGFGATGPNVLLFDDFENGTSGSWLSATGPKVGRWNYIKNFPSYAADYRRSGRASLAVSNYFPNDFGRNCPNNLGGCDGANYSAFGVDFGYYLGGGEAKEVYWEYSYFVVPGGMFPLETGYRINYKTSWIYGHQADHTDTVNDWRIFAGNSAPNSSGVLDSGIGTNNCVGCTDLYTDTSCGHNMYPGQEVLVSPKGRWVRHMEYAKGSTGCDGALVMMEAPFINTAIGGFACRSNSLNVCSSGTRAGQTCTGNDQCPGGGSCNYENAGGDRNTCEIVRKQRTGHKTLQSSIGSTGWGSLTLNAYASNADGNPVGAGSYQWRYDDVYIAVGPGARARVALANYRTWGDTAHGDTFDAMVCPPSSWTDTQVTCTVRQGSFTTGQNIYLFVIDAAGKVSDQDPSTPGDQGIPVLFGSSAIIPRAPTGNTAR